jgi:cytochrome P450 monooxygenase
MSSFDDLPAHMTDVNPHMLDVCPHLRELRDMAPVRKVRTVTGDQAWHVTGYSEVKQLFVDERLGRSHPDPENMPKFLGKDAGTDFVLSDDHDTADQIHAMMRAMLKPQFAAKHMEPLRSRVEAIADELLTGVIAQGPPADLHAGLAVPTVLEPFWELLGVPAGDRSRWTSVMSGDEFETGIPDMLTKLIGQKRERPGEDLVSRLCAATDRDDLVHVLSKATVSAGFGATVKTIDYGVVLLMQNPGQRDMVARDPELLVKTAEEMLRVSGGVSLPRYARKDIEIGGVTIQPNELVLLDLTLANLNDEVFDAPERFDVTRTPNRHLTFAHGVWSCLGSPFARLVMRSVFGRLLARLPTLSLAVPADQLSRRLNDRVNGLVEVHVTW